MVLESIISPEKAENKPWETFFIGFAYMTIAIVLSLWIFEDEASMVMVFLVVIASIPLVYNTMNFEESKDMLISKESSLLKEHNKAVSFLMFLFLGTTAASVLFYVLLPADTVNTLFEKQSSTIEKINKRISGNFSSSAAALVEIFFNNLKVLIFSILFSFIYGTGAIFILTWNSTVIAAAIGNTIRTKLSSLISSMGLTHIASYFHTISYGLLKYSVHGIPEIMSYFYGGLAGGILSTAIIRKHYKTDLFNHIMLDFFEILLLSLAFLGVAAFLEVYITPLLF
ncbi:stage II sporulation protein M [Candidatus Woesearchaeota archaeon]|nr:stage II sporulation protein M [Candidatus Woesearchaeota archaeon]MBI2661760.1 stage II sporulation protein M [Candidatus Woesearchaeota archaeon]